MSTDSLSDIDRAADGLTAQVTALEMQLADLAAVMPAWLLRNHDGDMAAVVRSLLRRIERAEEEVYSAAEEMNERADVPALAVARCAIGLHRIGTILRADMAIALRGEVDA